MFCNGQKATIVLSLAIYICLVYGDCPSGKVFKCNYEKCCDGTQYCSEADQMCRECIEENCFSPNYEPMCKDFCDVPEKFQLSTSIEDSYYGEIKSSPMTVKMTNCGTSTDPIIPSFLVSSWLPDSVGQRAFLAIIALVSALAGVAVTILIACLVIRKKTGNSSIAVCWGKDDVHRVLGKDNDRTTVMMTEVKYGKETMYNNGRGGESNVTELGNHGSLYQSPQKHSCQIRITNPENERPGLGNSVEMVTSGN